MSAQTIRIEKGMFVGAALASAAYGAHIVLFFQSLRYCTWRPGSASKLLLPYSLLLIALATSGFALETHLNILTFVDHGDQGCCSSTTYFDGASARPLTLATTAIFVTLNWLADAILLYRVCAVYNYGKRRWMGPLCSIAALLILVVLGSVFMRKISLLGTDFAAALDSAPCTTYLILSLALNICTTSAVFIPIAWHRWRYGSILMTSKTNPLSLPLMVLVEAASLYAILAIAVIVVIAVQSSIESVFLPMLGHLQAVPPMVAVLRISQKEYGAGPWTPTMHSTSYTFSSSKSQMASSLNRDINISAAKHLTTPLTSDFDSAYASPATSNFKRPLVEGVNTPSSRRTSLQTPSIEPLISLPKPVGRMTGHARSHSIPLPPPVTFDRSRRSSLL